MIGTFDQRLLLTPSGADPATLAQQVAPNWPFGPIAAVPLLPDDLPKPLGWTGTQAEWVRLASHARLLESAIMQRAQRVLVVEPGIRFQPDLASRWTDLEAAAGEEWIGIRLFGGTPELPIAYALQGRGIVLLYQSLRAPARDGGLLKRFAILRSRGTKSGIQPLASTAQPAKIPIVLVGAAQSKRREHEAAGAQVDEDLQAILTTARRPELRARLTLAVRANPRLLLLAPDDAGLVDDILRAIPNAELVRA